MSLYSLDLVEPELTFSLLLILNWATLLSVMGESGLWCELNLLIALELLWYVVANKSDSKFLGSESKMVLRLYFRT